MANGCILSLKCPVCSEIIWEDDWDLCDDIFIHNGCKKQFIKQKYHISEKQYNDLFKIDHIKQDILDLKNIIDYCPTAVITLEDQLNTIIIKNLYNL